MFAQKRVRIMAAALVVALTGGIAGVLSTSAPASARPASAAHTTVSQAAKLSDYSLSLNRVDLNGFVVNAAYTLGHNTGNTFQQTYTATTVQGVPIAGPFVGSTFPPVDYVAVPISDSQLYIAWLDPTTFAIDDAFVMNFAAHTVFDYTPGSAHPESAGTITVVKYPTARIP